MSPLTGRCSILLFATCILPVFVISNPLAASRFRTERVSRRSNSAELICGNAPSIVAGDPVVATDIFVPSVDDGPPIADTDPSGYFPYLWCGAGSSTYVFIDPIGSYGFNKGTNAPIFWTGLDGAYNATRNAMTQNAAVGKGSDNGDGLDNGDADIDSSHSTSVSLRINIGNYAGMSGVQWVQIFVQDANHQKLTWGIYGAALTIMKDFVLSYPLYADAMYFQISDGSWGTVGNGYMGIGLDSNRNGTVECYLKGDPAQNTGVSCGMPSNYPDN